MKRVLILFLLAIGVGCASGSRGVATQTGAAPADTLAGTLRVVGSAPMNVRLVIQGPAGTTPVGGSLESELRRLGSAEVVLRGRREGELFVATGYRIRSINGAPVTLGTVESVTGAYVQLRTEEGETVYLVGTPGQFQPGQKVWVQGPRAVVVQSHGTVRP